MTVKAPEVCLIRDIAPDNPATRGTLSYRNLATTALRLERAESAFMTDVWQAEPASIEERAAAHDAASAYLVRLADRVVTASTPAQHDLWAHRFTNASIEIYGQPDPREAKRLIHERQRELTVYRTLPMVDQRTVDNLLEFYHSVVGEPCKNEFDTIDRPLWQEISAFMAERFGPLLDIIDEACAGKEQFTPVDRKKTAVAALEWLSENHHPHWARWKVTEKNDANFSTYQDREELAVGMLAAPATPARAKNVLVHELLHALRSLNGRLTQDENLALGMPDRDMFEEGWAMLFGWAVSGDFNGGAGTLYRNIALALGSIDGRPLRRSKLLWLSYNTAKIDWQAGGRKGALPLTIKRDKAIHATRMYKGGRGDNFGTTSAIFTKDSVYHEGYKRAERYIRRMLNAGKTMSEIFDYLILGGFDPEDDQHVAYVERVTGKRL